MFSIGRGLAERFRDRVVATQADLAKRGRFKMAAYYPLPSEPERPASDDAGARPHRPSEPNRGFVLLTERTCARENLPQRLDLFLKFASIDDIELLAFEPVFTKDSFVVVSKHDNLKVISKKQHTQQQPRLLGLQRPPRSVQPEQLSPWSRLINLYFYVSH